MDDERSQQIATVALRWQHGTVALRLQHRNVTTKRTTDDGQTDVGNEHIKNLAQGAPAIRQIWLSITESFIVV